MSALTLLHGDCRQVLPTLEPGSVDLVWSSPPFMALRSYLPAGHELKPLEIGLESSPAAFLDALLDVVEACAPVLAPRGSLCFELGDTFSGSGGAGGDYNAGGLRDGQERFAGSAAKARRVIASGGDSFSDRDAAPRPSRSGRQGWPALDKSLCMIPELFAASLAYGRNLLRPERTTDPWRVRNFIVWHRCLDTDTPLYVRTPTGDRPMRVLHLHQQFAPGKFQLWTGQKWTNVIATEPTKTTDALEITFRNGERISCTRDHRWPVDRLPGLLSADELRVGDVVPWTTIPEPDQPRTPSALPADDIGWFVGLFLADGSFDSRDRIQISCHRDDELTIGSRLRDLAAKYDGTFGWYPVPDQNGAGAVIRSDVLAAVVRRYLGGGNARNKHLSEHSWMRGNDFIRALLGGYLDGDGHYDAKNDRWRLTFTDNQWLARDLRAMAARLGIELHLRRKRKHQSPDHWVQGQPFYFNGHVRFSLPGGTRFQPGQIVAIAESKRSTFVDIAVEDEPHLFALASGLLTHNSNPPVGALGDKFRPSTSYLTVACKSADRWFDLDAVRTPHKDPSAALLAYPRSSSRSSYPGGGGDCDAGLEGRGYGGHRGNVVGAPPLDCWFDEPDDRDVEMAEQVWTINAKGTSLRHFATFPMALAERVIRSMCPPEVCTVCGEPRRRLIDGTEYRDATGRLCEPQKWSSGMGAGAGAHSLKPDGRYSAVRLQGGWSDCGHGALRPGRVLDPFAGTGTTLAAALGLGRDAIGIELNPEYLDLARERVGLWLSMPERPVDDVKPAWDEPTLFEASS